MLKDEERRLLVALNERIQTEQDSNKLISDLVEYLKSLQAAAAPHRRDLADEVAIPSVVE